jgi:hypothetical protein
MELTVAEIEHIMSVPVFAVLDEMRSGGRGVLAPADALGRQLHELAGKVAR